MAAEEALLGTPDDAQLSTRLLLPIEHPPRAFRLLLPLTFSGTVVYVLILAYTALTGVGLWGNNIPVTWGMALVNFVWWIGIGHAGTVTSALLLLTRQEWRASINRVAEGMTLFALLNAAIMPVIHLGRPWFIYWTFPYPSMMGVWPQFRSPLTWDALAITAYLVVSLLFWHLGMVPDLASARDAMRGTWRRRVVGLFALGWRGEAAHWVAYEKTYRLLAGIALPLFVTVESIVSLDFAVVLLPGWHSTIFPAYFIAGALASGFATLLVLLIALRWAYDLYDVVTLAHLEKLGKLVLVATWFVIYSLVVEYFLAWYSGDVYDRQTHLVQHPAGDYAPWFWSALFLALVVPQALWIPALRRSPPVLLGVALLLNAGEYLERYVVIITAQAQDYLPSSWAAFRPTWVDALLFAGSISFFLFGFLSLVRFLPMIPIHDVKELRRTLESKRAREAGLPASTDGRTAAEAGGGSPRDGRRGDGSR